MRLKSIVFISNWKHQSLTFVQWTIPLLTQPLKSLRCTIYYSTYFKVTRDINRSVSNIDDFELSSNQSRIQSAKKKKKLLNTFDYLLFISYLLLKVNIVKEFSIMTFLKANGDINLNLIAYYCQRKLLLCMLFKNILIDFLL